MKQKKYFILAAAAALFAACSSDDIALQEPATQPAQQNAVSFDVYTQRGVTRAGVSGDVTTDALKDNATPTALNQAGFGVFAFYTDNNYYDQQSKPNFMYNEQVKYDGSAWAYSPLKYWPNEYGSTAISDDADKISFFAYAPFVNVTAATGKTTQAEIDANPFGIQSLTSNTTTGDPIVKYQGTFATNKGVDLCWAVCNQNAWPLVETGQNQEPNLEKGKPWLDVQRPADPTANQKLKFTFMHATAKLNVQINHFTDAYTNANNLADETRIYVRSVTFTGFAMEGALNLNNTEANKPLWLSYCCDNEISGGEEITIYDGRKEGKEGMAGAIASNEKVQGLNPQLIQTDVAFDYANPTVWSSDDAAPKGVTKNPQNLFAQWSTSNKKWTVAGSKTAPIYVIPTDDDVEVEIVYDVETIDDKLFDNLSDGKTHGSTIQNRIRKKINFGNTARLEAGKAYTIMLHLGMNSVKFDAEVSEWEDVKPATDIDLPANMPQFTAGNTGTQANADVLSTATTYTFAVTGFVGGETVTITDGSILTDAKGNSESGNIANDDRHANPSGVLYVTVTKTATYDVKNINYTPDIKIVGASGKEVTLNVKLLADKLGLEQPTVANDDLEFNLTRTNGTMVFDDGLESGATASIRIWRNNAELVLNGAGDNGFAIDADGKIKLKKKAVTGEEFRIVIKTGDVPEESTHFTVG
jgi:hypothetical protein